MVTFLVDPSTGRYMRVTTLMTGDDTPAQIKNRIALAQERNQQMTEAQKLRRDADDAAKLMQKMKLRLEDATRKAKMNPTAYTIGAMQEAAVDYEFAVSKYIAAEFAAEFAENRADGMGAREAYRKADAAIAPTMSEVKADAAKLEAEREKITSAQQYEARGMGPFKTTMEVAAAEEKALVLFGLAKATNATAEDGQNLLQAVDEAKSLHKDMRAEWRDERVGELTAKFMAEGKTEDDADKQARSQYARELQSYRKSGKWEDRLQQNAKMRRLGCGLCEGRVQEAHKKLPQVQEDVKVANGTYKRHRAKHEAARNAGDPEQLKESMDRNRAYYKAARNTQFIERVTQLETEGYRRGDAFKIAKSEYRKEKREEVRTVRMERQHDIALIQGAVKRHMPEARNGNAAPAISGRRMQQGDERLSNVAYLAAHMRGGRI